MAGIGFELKRLFAKKGIIATTRAYGYAGLVCAGPMLLGVALILGVIYLAHSSGIPRDQRELLVAMITYALLASLMVTSAFSMITTRYISDMIYTGQREKIMPSFYGSCLLMLVLGGLAYGIFLCFSGVYLTYKVLSIILFMTLIITWTEINYLTAIKDYKNIFLVFILSILLTFTVGYLLITFTDLPVVSTLLASVCIGYGVMSVLYFALIYKYFPEGFGTSMNFLRWIEKFPSLIGIGFFNTIGLFGHLVIMWSSPLGVQIKGLFYGAPEYDISALMAFFSILVTTISFITSVETKFYPHYRNYFSLFNEGGCISDIEVAESNMLSTLQNELSYLAQKQAFISVLFIVVGSLLLPRMQFGFSSDMLGIYRMLCVGYAFYAIGNSIMLVLLYFADNKGAILTTLLFAIVTNIVTFLLKELNAVFYGLGFIVGSAVFCLYALWRLDKYLYKLKYHVLGEQPVFATNTDGLITMLCDKLETRARKKQSARRQDYLGRMEKHEET
ncbi:MAG: exopolysaccharide Pel transporter PelG [Oscillospiraceae bacterium]|nr:exopolysaccharide Pel transporter PelG [Oscillospiraceae bacterium]MDD4414201.1 exopolysaccharide Pel transporter PelG [Oscillospiraceae bacterium]